MLKTVRLCRGLTIDDVWSGTQVNRGEYSRIENGKLDPTAKARQLLCAFFRLSEEELFPEYKGGPPESDRDLFRRLKGHLGITERIELLGNNPDHACFHRKLIAAAAKHRVEP